METGKIINTDTIQQELEQEKQLNRMDDMNGETSPYHELIVNIADRIEPLMTQMEQWSILSNILNYIQHNKYHTVSHTLNIKAVNKHRYKSEEKEEKEHVEFDFGNRPLKLHEEYLDVYGGIQSEIENTTRFDENSDLSMTYLGKSDRTRND